MAAVWQADFIIERSRAFEVSSIPPAHQHNSEQLLLWSEVLTFSTVSGAATVPSDRYFDGGPGAV